MGKIEKPARLGNFPHCYERYEQREQEGHCIRYRLSTEK